METEGFLAVILMLPAVDMDLRAEKVENGWILFSAVLMAAMKLAECGGGALPEMAGGFVLPLIFLWPLFRIRAVGHNPNAARLGGIRPDRIFVIAFLIAGGLAGAAGLTEINGVQHMLLQNFNSSIGSFGIGIAILPNGSPIGCIFASILFGFLNVMGTTMGRLPGLKIPASIIDLIEGIVMACVIMSYFVRAWADDRAQKRSIRKAGE